MFSFYLMLWSFIKIHNNSFFIFCTYEICMLFFFSFCNFNNEGLPLTKWKDILQWTWKLHFRQGKSYSHIFCVIITNPSYSKVDKQIRTCIEWIASDKIIGFAIRILFLMIVSGNTILEYPKFIISSLSSYSP